MTYEYLCSACGHAWEAEQSISEAPLTDCPSCKQSAAKRQVSGGAGFILKGGGWYSDLYSSAKKGDSSEAKASETKTGGTKTGETKTGETKTGETKTGETKASDKKDGSSSGGTPGKTQSTPPAT